MKVRLTALTAIVAGLFLAASCSKELQNTYATQETYIDAIVSSLTASADSATVTSNKGTIRVTVGHGSGEELREGGAVSFYYAGYYIKGRTLSSDNLFATNYDDFAGSIGWNVSDSSRFRIMTVDLAMSCSPGSTLSASRPPALCRASPPLPTACGSRA